MKSKYIGYTKIKPQGWFLNFSLLIYWLLWCKKSYWSAIHLNTQGSTKTDIIELAKKSV